MTGIDPERRLRRLHWAAELLELNPGASADQIRSVMLRRLPELDFVPSPEWRWAMEALLVEKPAGKSEERADDAAARAAEEQLRDEVEAFAAKFWELPPDPRRERWQELRDRCAFDPALRARLGLLERGLGEVPFPRQPVESERTVELANQVGDLFVLRPGPRARARQAFLNRLGDNGREWAASAWRLRLTCPILASLGSDLLEQVEGAPLYPRAIPKPQPQSAATSEDGNIPWRIIWVVVIVIGSLLRGFMSIDNPSPPPPSFDRSNPDSPFHPSKAREGVKTLSPDWYKKLNDPTNTPEDLKKLAEELARSLKKE